MQTLDGFGVSFVVGVAVDFAFWNFGEVILGGGMECG